MHLTLKLLQQGILLGLGAAVPIGPVNVEIARRTLRSGFLRGFALGCGAVSIDVAYAVASSLSLGRILQRPAVLWSVGIAGILLLTYLGVLCLRAASRSLHDAREDPFQSATRPIITDASGAPSARAAYATGLLMTLLNPMTLAFWFVAVPGLVGTITDQPGRDLPMICAGVFFGTIAWVTFFSSLLSVLGRYRRNWWLALADLFGGLMLLVFAGVGLWRLLRLPL